MEFKPSRYEWESGGNDKTPDLDSITDVGSRFVLGFLHFFCTVDCGPSLQMSVCFPVFLETRRPLARLDGGCWWKERGGGDGRTASRGGKDGCEKVGRKETTSRHVNDPLFPIAFLHTACNMCSFVRVRRTAGTGSFLPEDAAPPH